MEIDPYHLLAGNEVMLVFLVIGVGYLVGNLRIGGIELGSTTGVLLAGLLFGHLGFEGPPKAATFGFTLFIFSVGLQAGPRFFSVFAEDGRKYVSLSLVVAVTGAGLAIAFSTVLGLEFGLDAGLLAGALTSTPTLAGAKDAITGGLAVLPDGMTAEEAVSNVSVGYAITYVFGTAGLIAFIRYFPVIVRVDLPAEARKLAKERGFTEGEGPSAVEFGGLPIIRAYRIPEGGRMVGKSIRELSRETDNRFVIQRIRRDDEVLHPDPDSRLHERDTVAVIASVADHRQVQEQVGREVLDDALINHEIVSQEIVVIKSEVAGRPLKELNLTSEHGCFPEAIIRASIRLLFDDNMTLAKGDRLLVSGEKSRVLALAERVGHIEQDIQETDLLTFSMGIVGGILLGTVLIKLGSLSIGLGSAGGLLLAGILIGFLSSLHPTFGRVPAAARFILMELGLMLFMASVGLDAGGDFVEVVTAVGPSLVLCGMVVTTAPVLVGYAFGRHVLKLNPVLLLGSIAGAMTSTPSLNVVTATARSSLPALGYAGTYTFANVFLTFAGTVILML